MGEKRFKFKRLFDQRIAETKSSSQHRSYRRPRKQLSCPERLESTGRQVHCTYAGTTLQGTSGYDIYKISRIFSFIARARKEHAFGRDSIRKTLQNSLERRRWQRDIESGCWKSSRRCFWINNYCIQLDHSILDNHGVFYQQALYNDLVFELTLASASQVVKGSGASKLVYKLTKHSNGVWDHPQQDIGRQSNQRVQQRQGVRIWSYVRRGGDLHKIDG